MLARALECDLPTFKLYIYGIFIRNQLGSQYAFTHRKKAHRYTKRRNAAIQMEEEDDAVGMLLQLLDDLLIYEPGTVLEYAGKKPSREDLESIQSDTTVKILRILKRYVRPRNEVLRIRRTKFGKSRMVPLHPTAVNALDSYLKERRRLVVTDEHVFLSAGNRRISSSTVEYTFGRMRRLAGIFPDRTCAAAESFIATEGM